MCDLNFCIICAHAALTLGLTDRGNAEWPSFRPGDFLCRRQAFFAPNKVGLGQVRLHPPLGCKASPHQLPRHCIGGGVGLGAPLRLGRLGGAVVDPRAVCPHPGAQCVVGHAAEAGGPPPHPPKDAHVHVEVYSGQDPPPRGKPRRGRGRDRERDDGASGDSSSGSTQHVHVAGHSTVSRAEEERLREGRRVGVAARGGGGGGGFGRARWRVNSEMKKSEAAHETKHLENRIRT